MNEDIPMMRFSLEGDFSGGEYDEQTNEFYAKNFKKKKKLTKDEQIYGIFADEFGSSEDENFYAKRKHKKAVGGGSVGDEGGYIRAVQFISGGVNKGTLGEDKGVMFLGGKDDRILRSYFGSRYAEDEEEEEEDSCEHEKSTYVSNNKAEEKSVGNSSGLLEEERIIVNEYSSDISDLDDEGNSDVKKAGKKVEKSKKCLLGKSESLPYVKEAEESSRLLNNECIVSSSGDDENAGRKNEKVRVRKFKFVEEENKDSNNSHVKNKHTVSKAAKNNLFRSEKEVTKNKIQMQKLSKAYGVGFKLLQKMGYDGGGLGRDGKGLVDPLQVKIRQRNRGLQDEGERIIENDFLRGDKNSCETGYGSGGNSGGREGGTVQDSLEVLLMRKDKGDSTRKREKQNWRVGSNATGDEKGKQKRTKTYKAAAEIAEEFKILAEEELKEEGKKCEKRLRIIDMTGPDVKIIETSEDLSESIVGFKSIAERADDCYDGGFQNSSAEQRVYEPLKAWRNRIQFLCKEKECELKEVIRERKKIEDALIELSYDTEKMFQEGEISEKSICRAESILSTLMSIKLRLKDEESHSPPMVCSGGSTAKQNKEMQNLYMKYKVGKMVDRSSSSSSSNNLNKGEEESCRQKNDKFGFSNDGSDDGFVRVLGGAEGKKLHKENMAEEGETEPKEDGRGESAAEKEGKEDVCSKPSENAEVCGGRKEGNVGMIKNDELHKIFCEIKEECIKENKFFNIGIIFLSFIKEYFCKIFSCWLPLENPDYGVNFVHLWVKFFASFPSSFHALTSSNNCYVDQKHNNCSVDNNLILMYNNIVSEVIGYKLRHSLTNQWNINNVEQGLKICETWKTLISPCMYSSLLYDCIYPRLVNTVDTFDFFAHNSNNTNFSLPLHCIIHPFLSLFNKRCVETLLSNVKYKLCLYLQNFNPLNLQYMHAISPWERVFDGDTWRQILNRYIVPKFNEALYMFNISFQTQNLSLIQNLIRWKNILTLDCVAQILHNTVLPRWLQTLQMWFWSPSAVYDEILVWYETWKNLLGDELLKHSLISPFFFNALQLMNNAAYNISNSLNVKEYSTANENVNNLLYNNFNFNALNTHSSASSCHTSQSPLQPPQRPQPPGSKPNFFNVPSSSSPSPPEDLPPPFPDEEGELINLKHYIEEIAAERSILFIPKVGRSENGKQVYAFGKTSIYFEKNVVFAYLSKKWVPVDIQQILDENI